MKDNVINTKYTTFDLMFTLDEIKRIYDGLCLYPHTDDIILANKIKEKMLLAGIDLTQE